MYGDNAKLFNHAESLHSSPTKITPRNNADIRRITFYKQLGKAFTGSLKLYQLKRKTTSIDLPEVHAQQRKPETKLSDRVNSRCSQKVQLKQD